MQWYRADLHVHTVLSPCGGLDMSPVNIIRQAALKKLDIIGITDHNSTKHCRSAFEIGQKYGITVLAGTEVNTREEIHCLTFFDTFDKVDIFQQYLDDNLTVIENKPEIFGNQYIVDEHENILGEESRLLVASLQKGIDEVAEQVAQLEGILIPAHINRMSNSVYSQLGFLPAGLKAQALEIFTVGAYEDFLSSHPEIRNFCLVKNSDAHSSDQIGAYTTDYFLKKPVFSEIVLALKGVRGRKTGKL